MFAFNATVAEHPEVKLGTDGVMDAAIRSLTRPQAVGFSRAFAPSISNVPLYSPGGIFYGRGRRLQR
jgi:hypothetical protein